jgi:hypothetical protein
VQYADAGTVATSASGVSPGEAIARDPDDALAVKLALGAAHRDVSGERTLKGNNVTSGTVLRRGADGRLHPGETSTNVPVGLQKKQRIFGGFGSETEPITDAAAYAISLPLHAREGLALSEGPGYARSLGAPVFLLAPKDGSAFLFEAGRPAVPFGAR